MWGEIGGKTYNLRQKIFDKWIHQQWKMFDSQWWKIFDTKIFDRRFSTPFFPVENIPPLIKRNSKMFHHTVENIPMTKIAQRIFWKPEKLQQYHRECWNNFDMKNQGHRQHFKFAYIYVVVYFKIVTFQSKEFQNIVYIIESFSNKAHLP